MNRQHPLPLVAATAAALFALSIGAGAQVEFNNNVKFNSGQDVQPVFEGWSRAADGTFDLHFGYLNRNWVEHQQIPVGRANHFQPGEPDRGQPTYFYTRTHRKVFTVKVPADFGKKELIWTLTANGTTRTAYGHLRADWEITPDGGASGTRTTKEARSNQPPALTIAPAGQARVGVASPLAATVADDGLPVPRGRMKPAVGQETPPTLIGDAQDLPANLPWLRGAEDRSGGGPAAGDGLSVRWIVFRGPADASFQPALAKVTEGKATTSVTFKEPGEYTLRAAAHDGLLTTAQNVTVSVTR